MVHQLLFLKYYDWRYEHEARVFTPLGTKDSQSGLYFADFDEDSVLQEVIVGPLSVVTERDLREALGEHWGQVTPTKARLAFNSFNVVRNKLEFQCEGA